jgi:hypothetical protein
MNTEDDMNKHRPLRRPPPFPDRSGQRHSEKRLQPYPFREQNTRAALAHCELSDRLGDEKFDCPLKALARRLIKAEGEWIADMREDEAIIVQAVFGLQIKWQATNGARWTGFWTVPLPAGGQIQEEVKAFEQFLASRPEPNAMKAAANSIRHIAALISGYVADMLDHGGRPAPWNEPESRPGPAPQHDTTSHP